MVSKIGQNANLVNRAYLVNMLTRLLSWSKIVKNRTIEWKSKRGQKNAEPHLLSLLCFLNSGYLSAGKIQLQGASVKVSNSEGVPL